MLLKQLTFAIGYCSIGLLLAGCDTSMAPASTPVAAQTSPAPEPAMTKIEIKKDKVVRTEDEWRQTLTPEQFHILREKGTERAFTGRYWDTTEPGVYKCAGCGQVLFTSTNKFDSHCGWPAFDRAFAEGTITETRDTTFGMERVEVTCTRCGAHLGHIFDDGPTETGMRYCINSASIDLEKMEKPPEASR